MLLVLTGVTAVSVALLAYVNELTKEPIAQANAKTLSDAMYALFRDLTIIPCRKLLKSERIGRRYFLSISSQPKAENLLELP